MKKYNSTVHLIKASSDIAGQRIDNFLFSYFKGVSKNKIYQVIRKGSVRINKKRVKWIYKLQSGDIIRVPPIKNIVTKMTVNIEISKKMCKQLNSSILFEDDDLIILNKPSGISVHGGRYLTFNVITVLRFLRPELNFLELVHRLDHETSGLLLLAKNRPTLIQLHEQLRLRMIQKEYLALLYGQCSFSVKMVVAPLLKHIFLRGSYFVKIDSMHGKYSKTCFVVKERFGMSTLVQVIPFTGRTHQIRVHAQYIGNPVVLDNRYGNIYFNNMIKSTMGLNRLFLHASKLIFIHPKTRQSFSIQAPLDACLLNCLFCLKDSVIK